VAAKPTDLVPSGAGLAARPGHCDVEEPQLRGFGAEQEAACHYPLERWPMSGEEIRRADEAVAAG
jgi:hypothetical protein